MTNPSPADLSRSFPPLPPWIAARLLRPDEQVTWVAGPKRSPRWEWYATHPALVVVALAAALLILAAGRLAAADWKHLNPAAGLTAVFLVIGTVIALAVCNGYFTRLVVTNHRLLVLQGREVCRSWGVDRLPRSLVRYGRTDRGEGDRTVDLDALRDLLGGAEEKFGDAKTILTFSKNLDRIKNRDEDVRR